MTRTLKNIWELGLKELIGLLRNPLMLILIVYSFTYNIYESATSTTDTINEVAIAVVDEDHSALSRRIRDAFLPPHFKKAVVIPSYEADQALNEGKYTFVLVLPLNLERDILAGRKPPVQLNIDATQMGVAYAGAGAVEQIVATEITRHFGRERLPKESFIDLQTRNRYNPNLVQSWSQAISDLVGAIAMLAIILTGSALINEREHGTMEHLMVMPVTPFEIMVSKIWAMTLVVLIAVVLTIFCVIKWSLHIPIAGSIPLFLIGVTLVLFAINSLGIFLATVSSNMPQLGMLVILVLMPMNMLSGGSTPLESMPPFIRKCAAILPTTHFNTFSSDILYRGVGIEVVWKSFLAIFVIGLILFVFSLSRFRKSIAS